MSDPRPVFEARPVFKAQLVLVPTSTLQLTDGNIVYFAETISTFVKMLMICSDWQSEIRKPKY